MIEYNDLPLYAQRAIRHDYVRQCRAMYDDLYDDVVEDFLKDDAIAKLFAEHLEARFDEYLHEADRDGTWSNYLAELEADAATLP